jgi:hypothetical protein
VQQTAGSVVPDPRRPRADLQDGGGLGHRETVDGYQLDDGAQRGRQPVDQLEQRPGVGFSCDALDDPLGGVLVQPAPPAEPADGSVVPSADPLVIGDRSARSRSTRLGVGPDPPGRWQRNGPP